MNCCPSKQNDPLTLLNLACLKHTGCPLPISEFSGNNWKYKFDQNFYEVSGGLMRGKAKWSPHPYFNPLHLYYPSDDFGVRVLRSNLVDEIKYCKSPGVSEALKVNSIGNPYRYKGVTVVIQLQHNSIPSKINRLFLEDLDGYNDFGYPHFGYNSKQVIHHPRTRDLDEGIMKRKCAVNSGLDILLFGSEYKWDIWTQKGDLRKRMDTVDTIYELGYLAIGMSSTSNEFWFKGVRTTLDDISRILKGNPPWRFKGKTYYEWIEPRWKQEPKLTPEDFIRIYNPQSINKQEKINQALIANFPN